MNKALKWILIGGAALVIVCAAAIYVILTSYDFNALKPTISSAVEDATGRKLEIGGDINVSVGLTPSLVVSDVRFANASWGSRPDLAAVKRFEVQVALAPLLTKKIEVKRFILIEPDILVETNEKGKLNVIFEPLSTPSETREQKPSKKEEGPKEPLALTLDEFEIQNAKFTYRDGKTDQTYSALLKKLKAGSESMSSPVKIDLDALYNEMKVQVEGELGAISAATDPAKDWPLDLNIDAMGIDATVKGKITDLMTPSGVNIAVTGQIENFDQLNPLLKPILKNDIPPAAPVSLAAQISDSGEKKYRIDDLNLTFGGKEISGRVKGKIADAVSQKGIDLDISLQLTDFAPLEPFLQPYLKNGAPPVAPVNFKADIQGDLQGDLSLKDIDLTFGEKSVTGQVKGSIRDAMAARGLNLSISADISDFQPLEKFLESDLPPLAPVSFKTDISDAGEMIFKAKDVTLTFAGSDVSGEASADLSGKTPAVKAILASQEMDLNSMLKAMEKENGGKKVAGKKSKEQKPEKASGRPGKVFPDDPLPLEILDTVNADIGYRAESLYLPTAALHSVDLGILIRNGNLSVTPLKAKLGGGNLDGEVSLKKDKANAAQLSARLVTSQFDLGAMLKELAITDMMSGRVNLDLNVSASGGSVAKLMGDLDGYSKIIMKNGAIHNRYVGLIGANLDSALAKLLTPDVKNKGLTPINCFVNRFDFKNGVADTTVLAIDSELMIIVGDGKIDLGKESLNMSVNPRPKDKAAEVGTSIGSLAKNFKIGGSLAKPAVKVDAVEALKTVEKAVRGTSLKGGLMGVLSALETETETTGDICPAAIESANSGQKPNWEQKAQAEEKKSPAAVGKSSDELQKPASPSGEETPKKENVKKDLEDLGGKVLKGLFGD